MWLLQVFVSPPLVCLLLFGILFLKLKAYKLFLCKFSVLLFVFFQFPRRIFCPCLPACSANWGWRWKKDFSDKKGSDLSASRKKGLFVQTFLFQLPICYIPISINNIHRHIKIFKNIELNFFSGVLLTNVFLICRSFCISCQCLLLVNAN